MFWLVVRGRGTSRGSIGRSWMQTSATDGNTTLAVDGLCRVEVGQELQYVLFNNSCRLRLEVVVEDEGGQSIGQEPR